jgi:hypothetical protein
MDAGGGVGELKTSPAVIIRANTAPNTDTPSLDSTNGGTAYDDEDLIGTAGTTTDADGDATTNIFHWTRDGVSQTNMQLPFDTEVPTVPGVNGITRDYSGYGNDAAVNGTRWIQDGVVGGAMDFDGSDRVQVIDTNNKLGRDGSWSEMTVEFWVKSTEDIETFYFPWILLAMHNTSFSALSFPGYFSPYGLAYNVEFSSTNGYDQIQWIIYTDSGEVAAVTNIGNARSWHHITCTYESGVGLMIYVDGTLSASVYCTGNITAVADGILDIGGTGHEGFGQYGSSTDFIGSLDEVRIYPTALSAAQIFQRYIDTKDGLSDSETIVPQETTAGESWICQIIPNDSWEDGIAVNSQSLNVNATVGNSSPKIEWYSPIDLTLDVAFGNTTEFKQVSSDPNGDLLNYTWTLDSIEQATTQNWTYTPTATGSHQVRVTVSDGSLSD